MWVGGATMLEPVTDDSSWVHVIHLQLSHHQLDQLKLMTVDSGRKTDKYFQAQFI